MEKPKVDATTNLAMLKEFLKTKKIKLYDNPMDELYSVNPTITIHEENDLIKLPDVKYRILEITTDTVHVYIIPKPVYVVLPISITILKINGDDVTIQIHDDERKELTLTKGHEETLDLSGKAILLSDWMRYEKEQMYYNNDVIDNE